MLRGDNWWGFRRMGLPVIDPRLRPFRFLPALGLKMEALAPNKAKRVSVQALAGIVVQLPCACDLNLHLREGRVITLQWLPGQADKATPSSAV